MRWFHDKFLLGEWNFLAGYRLEFDDMSSNANSYIYLVKRLNGEYVEVVD